MEDFANILQRDYGLKPQGKSAPMAGSRGLGLGIGGENGGSSSWREGSTGRASRNGGNGRGSLLEPSLDEFGEDMFGAGSNGNVRAPPRTNLDDPYGLASGSGYDDVFGGPPKYSSPKYGSHDDIFRVSTKPQSGMSKSVNLPVFDTPVYDDDIFGGVPGTRNTSSVFDDVFSASGGGGGGSAAASTSQFEDLLGGYSTATDRKPKPASASNRSGSVRSSTPLEVDRVFDDLLSGVSSVESSKLRWSTDSKPSQNAEPQPSISSISPAEVSAGFVDPIISIMQQTSASVPLGSDNLGGQSETFTDGAGSSTEADVIDGFTPTYDSYFPPSSRTIKEGRRKDNAGLASDSTFKDGSGFPLFSSGGDTSSVFPESETVEPAYFTKSARPAKNIWRKDTGDSATEASFGEGSGFPVFGSSVESASISDTEPIEASYLPKTSRPAKDRQKDTGSSTTNSSIKEESAFAFFGASASPPSIPSEREREEPVPEETWLTVEEIKLVTAPSTMPPPSRRAPKLRYEKEAFSFENVFENDGAEFSSESSWQAPPVQVRQQAASPPWAPGTAEDVMKEAAARGIDGLEEFVAGVLHKTGAPNLQGEEGQGDREGAGSPPMKDATERGDVKFRLAKEAREKDREEKQREAMIARAIAREREEREAKEQKLREAREKEEKEREAREERERERQRRERLKEREREREKDRAAERAAVERAAAEARERAAVEAKERAERAAFERAAAEARERAANDARERAERAAVERAAAEARERAANEARERAERAAVERAAAEARERAANEARERAERGAVERAAAEARERAANEARERVERAAVERATAEARERATAEARRAAAESRARAESAAAEAREKAERNAAERARDQQRRSETDWDRLFGNRANSEPRQRPQNLDHAADARSSQTFGSERRGPSSMPPVRKVSSSTNIADDWTSLFAPASQDVFQEIEGETPDRRKARWERHQRTLERAAKALADKNQRDLDQQWEQAEKHRAGEVLDTEIKRWAAGKEGNLRALLSTLQYVLWPECGWQAISLTDIISAIAVKKAYRKATLCVHPDKVQQKGATVQQKYIAEKVFDILKEAWNKFNSEELF